MANLSHHCESAPSSTETLARDIAGLADLTRQHPTDPLRAQWINLLPPPEGRTVLIWGPANSQTAALLFARGCKELICVGSTGPEGEQPGTIQLRTLDEVPHNTADVVIVVRKDFCVRDRPPHELGLALASIKRLLKPGGFLLLALPAGFRSMTVRHRLVRALGKSGVTFLKTYLVDFSAYSVTIVPYSENPTWASKYLSASPAHSASPIVSLLKSATKRALYRKLGTNNPRYGLLIVARTDSDQEVSGNRSFSERVRLVARSQINSQVDPAVVLWTRPHSDKHHFFAYDVGNSRLLAVGQIAGQIQGQKNMAERSFRNLTLLSPLSVLFEEMSLEVPRLLDSDYIGNSTFYVRSALGGGTLDNLVRDCRRRNDRRTLERLLGRALDLQIQIQDLLTRHVAQYAYQIEDHYFEGGQSRPQEEDARLNQASSQMVQHGDFAPINILLKPAHPEWGVIDWEWMGTCFPPLFDLFTFCSRVHYLRRRRRGLTFFQEFFESFVDSFFSPTWFSAFVAERIEAYCNHFRIENRVVFQCFIRYLRFQCGKYRHAMPGYPHFQDAYEACLRWSIENKERFICR